MEEVIHTTVAGIERDDDGFVFATCACGFVSMPCPDEETLIDVMMEHASA